MLKKTSDFTHHGWPLAALLVLSWVAASAAFGQQQTPEATPSEPAVVDTPSTAVTHEPEARHETAPPAAELRAYRDPVSGEITTLPQGESFEKLDPATAKAMSRSSAGLETFELHFGGVGVHLGGRFRNAMIAHRHADGTLSSSCVDHPEHAAAALSSEVPPTEPVAPAQLEER